LAEPRARLRLAQRPYLRCHCRCRPQTRRCCRPPTRPLQQRHAQHQRLQAPAAAQTCFGGAAPAPLAWPAQAPIPQACPAVGHAGGCATCRACPQPLPRPQTRAADQVLSTRPAPARQGMPQGPSPDEPPSSSSSCSSSSEPWGLRRLAPGATSPCFSSSARACSRKASCGRW
jgi:hypothetical protein